MNFGGLKQNILDLIGRAPADMCYELVTSEINEGVRLASMQAEITFTADETYTLPADFLEAISVYLIVGGNRYVLEAVEPVTLDDVYQAGSVPTVYSISDGVMRLSGGSGGGTISLRYYQKQADLILDTDVNGILTNHPSVYVYGTLAHHYALIRDTAALSVHFPAYERALGNARKADIAKRTGGIVSAPRPRTTP